MAEAIHSGLVAPLGDEDRVKARRFAGRLWSVWASTALTATSATPVTTFKFPSASRLRWILAALAGVSVAGLVPVSIGTAPSGACLARRAPWTPFAIPVS